MAPKPTEKKGERRDRPREPKTSPQIFVSSLTFLLVCIQVYGLRGPEMFGNSAPSFQVIFAVSILMGSKLWNRGCRLGIQNFFSHLRLLRTNHEENEHFQPSLFAKSTHRRLWIFNHDLDRLGFRDVPRPVGEDVSVELAVDSL